jgi:hypothetical protein
MATDKPELHRTTNVRRTEVALERKSRPLLLGIIPLSVRVGGLIGMLGFGSVIH